MLREGGEGAEDKIEDVLEEDWEIGNWGVGSEGWGEGFDVRPG